MSEKFDSRYFEPYLERNLARVHRGSRPFLYSFWLRNLRRLISPRARVLEAGCGLGFFAARLSRNYSIVALDVSLAALSFVQRQWNITSVTCADATALPFHDEAFDAIVAFDLIEHLASPEKFLIEAFRVLCRQGVIVLSTPNPESFGARLKGRHVTDGRSPLWFGDRDQTHVSIHCIDDWRRMFLEMNFEVLRDGTDFLWDPPYFQRIPVLFQKLLFNGTQWIGTWLVGFLPWRFGENYVAILRRPLNLVTSLR